MTHIGGGEEGNKSREKWKRALKGYKKEKGTKNRAKSNAKPTKRKSKTKSRRTFLMNARGLFLVTNLKFAVRISLSNEGRLGQIRTTLTCDMKSSELFRRCHHWSSTPWTSWWHGHTRSHPRREGSTGSRRKAGPGRSRRSPECLPTRRETKN